MGKCTLVVAKPFLSNMFDLDMFKGKIYSVTPKPENETFEFEIELDGKEGPVEVTVDTDRTLLFKTVQPTPKRVKKVKEGAQ